MVSEVQTANDIYYKYYLVVVLGDWLIMEINPLGQQTQYLTPLPARKISGTSSTLTSGHQQLAEVIILLATGSPQRIRGSRPSKTATLGILISAFAGHSC